MFTKDILKEAKKTFTALNYEYPGYIKDGEVRVKRTEDEKPSTIRTKTDIARVANQYKNSNDTGDG